MKGSQDPGFKPGFILLPRTGNSFLEVNAEECLSEISTQSKSGHGIRRWHEVEVYSLMNGDFAVCISYLSEWESEKPGHFTSFEVASLADVITELRHYDPLIGLQARPENTPEEKERNSKFNETLRFDVTHRFKTGIGWVAEDLGVTERQFEAFSTTQITVSVPEQLLHRLNRARRDLSLAGYIESVLNQYVP